MTVPTPATKQEIEKLFKQILEHPPEAYRDFIRDQRDQFAIADGVRYMADQLYPQVVAIGPLNVILSSLLMGFVIGRWHERERVEEDQKLNAAWGVTGVPEPTGPDPKGFDPDKEREFLENQLRQIDDDKEGGK
jgi:hypothetical protein